MYLTEAQNLKRLIKISQKTKNSTTQGTLIHNSMTEWLFQRPKIIVHYLVLSTYSKFANKSRNFKNLYGIQISMTYNTLIFNFLDSKRKRIFIVSCKIQNSSFEKLLHQSGFFSQSLHKFKHDQPLFLAIFDAHPLVSWLV